MSDQTYLQIVAEVRHVCSALSLQLPLRSAALASQRRIIASIQHKLEILETKVRTMAHRSWRPTKRDDYQTLDCLLCNLLTETINMALLADEFQSDPEGTVSCLRSVTQRKNQLIQQLQSIEDHGRIKDSSLIIKRQSAKKIVSKSNRNNRPQYKPISHISTH